MAELFTLDNFVTLGLLTLLQAVLGFDNLLYISLESKGAPPEKRAYVRKVGITIAIFLRIGLLFLLTSMIKSFQVELFPLNIKGYFESHFNLHSLIVLAGGAFIIYTATKEILHMMALEKDTELSEAEPKKPKSINSVIAAIIVMNLVFSFDSILSAIALTDVFAVMAAAIIIGGVLMIWLSDSVSNFLQKNRMYEVLGLFILFVVGIMLITEGGHLAHIRIMGNEITPMSKTTFYFVITVLILTDIVQGRYPKKLSSQLKKKA